MPLKLMFITNDVDIAKIAEIATVDRIIIDMEYIGKSVRQSGMDTVQSHHSISDIYAIKHNLNKAQVVVRCNPIHNATAEYTSSKKEIEDIIKAGADMIMLPYFKTVNEVQTFISYVNYRTKVFLLFETPESVANVHKILQIPGIDEVLIGLNDLSLGYHKKFMFELLSDGTVEYLCNIFKYHNIPYGFGGIAAIGQGKIPAEKILKEHYRLGSTCTILSRSFCNSNQYVNLEQLKQYFIKGVDDIRNYENEIIKHLEYFSQNTTQIIQAVNEISKNID